MMTLKLNRFRIACFEFVLTFEEQVVIPQIASSLRGLLGRAFERLCEWNERDGCKACRDPWQECPNTYIFRTLSPAGQNPRRYSNHPHPFVLEPPLTNQETFEAGHTLTFRLVLIGKGIRFLPYFIDAFQHGGKHLGIGHNRGKFDLTTIDVIFGRQRTRIYHLTETPLQLEYPIMHFNDIVKPSHNAETNLIQVTFLTPTRLKIRKHFIPAHQFQFVHLFNCLIRRLSDLLPVHCDEPPPHIPDTLKQRAQAVQAESHLHWSDRWAHYSSSQHTRMKLGGLVGNATFKGDLTPFLPLLKLGSWLHVGKSTAFGNGKYSLRELITYP